MPKSKIEWLRDTDGRPGYSVNPVKGMCPHACVYCYARAMYKRFKWEPELKFDWSVAQGLPKMKPGSKVFWGSTMDLFGDWIKPEWSRLIFEAVKRHPELTHIFLTKQPQRLAEFSPFPKNAWVGVTATNTEMLMRACSELEYPAVAAKITYLSIEPLLAWSFNWNKSYLVNTFKRAKINLIIIGAQTKPTVLPKIAWVREIVEAADQAGIPVFLKNNLLPLVSKIGNASIELTAIRENSPGSHSVVLRQEMPGTKG
ncbi:MAG: DUF5131 family protein [Dehalococcoidia bacterium]|nr:DUF5131 family protein [Dehalococcoidia bacterium]